MNSQFSTGFVIALVIGIAVGALWPKYGPDLTNTALDRVGNAQQVSFAGAAVRHDGRGGNGGCEQASPEVVGHGTGHGQSACGQSACRGNGESACRGKGSSVGHRSVGHRSVGHRSVGHRSMGHRNGQSDGHGKNASAGRGNGQGRGHQSARSQQCSESGCDHSEEASTSEPSKSEHAQREHDRANDHSLAKHDGPGLGLGLGLGRGWGRDFKHAEAETADDTIQDSGRN